MVYSTLQKLLRSQSQSAAKIITHFQKPHPPLPPVVTQITQITNAIDEIETPFHAHPATDRSKPNPSFASHLYPTFSFGFFLNPISPPALIRPEPDEGMTPDDSRTIRADSVKKKRKKKMNKHKLRKLRKRLRRKT
ncbi:hypothetical protein BUALT_Bualt04G0166500 [Buddleja alternifolia]|uniref:Small ribosomal subunit protein mS38 n=1 Tax=Buddleja alternifolia TaxID=168488 RepID=A0AAV6XXR9_9LAMI|nr:hypothetical protein BUALT_Bualt04G0166500 [Buddleja alternifolia]